MITASLVSVYAASVGAAPANDDLVQLIVSLLHEEDKDIRALALEQIRSEAEGEHATQKFAGQLPELPAESQVGLLRALAVRGDSAARPAVLEILADTSEEEVQVAAIQALSSLGKPEDWGTLMQRWVGGSPAVRTAARESLVRLPGESVSRSLAREIRGKAPAHRVALIEILAARRARGSVPEILEAAVDASPTVRSAAMKALGELAGPEHLAYMVPGVLRAEPGAERAAAEKAVMFVCHRMPDRGKCTEALIAAIEKLNAADRTAMLSTLGRVGGGVALPVIDAAIASSDAKVHSEGIRALSHWPDASVASRLITLAQSDTHAGHRTTALRALIRVAPLPDGRTEQQKLDLLRKAMAMSRRDAELNLALKRAAAIRLPETLRLVKPYMNKPRYAQQACATVVELAHHRSLRQPNKTEFDEALNKAIRISQNPTVVERARRYKKDQTWVRPKAQNR